MQGKSEAQTDQNCDIYKNCSKKVKNMNAEKKRQPNAYIHSIWNSYILIYSGFLLSKSFLFIQNAALARV